MAGIEDYEPFCSGEWSFYRVGGGPRVSMRRVEVAAGDFVDRDSRIVCRLLREYPLEHCGNPVCARSAPCGSSFGIIGEPRMAGRM